MTHEDFKSKFGADLETIFGIELNKMHQQKLLTIEDNRIRLTLRGMLLSNQVFSSFLQEAP